MRKNSILIFIFVSLLLSACGGSSSTSAPTSAGGTGSGTPAGGGSIVAAVTKGTAPTSSYNLFYQGAGVGEEVASLYAVNSLNATVPIKIVSQDLGPIGGIGFKTGTFDAVNKQITGMYYQDLLYSSYSTGQVFKVGATTTAALSSPAQVSNISSANGICSTWGPIIDYANYSNSALFLNSAGHTSCSTAPSQMITIGMGSANPPISVPALMSSPITALYSSTGAIAGWLVTTSPNNTLSQCNSNFSSCVSVAPSNLTVTNVRLVAYNIFNNSMILMLNNQHLRAFTVNFITPQLVSSTDLYTYTNTVSFSYPASFSSDGTNLYFSDTSKLYSLPLTGTTPTLIYNESPNNVTGITVGANSIVYSYCNPASTYSNCGLKSVALPGLTITTIFASSNLSGSLVLDAAVGSNVYYHTVSSSYPYISNSGIISNSGVSQLIEYNSSWYAGTRTTYSSGGGVVLGLANNPNISKMILSEGCDLITCTSSGNVTDLLDVTAASFQVDPDVDFYLGLMGGAQYGLPGYYNLIIGGGYGVSDLTVIDPYFLTSGNSLIDPTGLILVDTTLSGYIATVDTSSLYNFVTTPGVTSCSGPAIKKTNCY